MNGVLAPTSVVQDTAQESRTLGGVHDWDNRFMGPVTAAQGLLASRNVAAEQAMQLAGIDNVIRFAHGLGISTPINPNLSSAIGSTALRMIDHASAYAAFANGGHRVTAHGILKAPPFGQEAVDVDVAHGRIRVTGKAHAMQVYLIPQNGQLRVEK